MPHPKPTTIKPKDSRYERGTTAGKGQTQSDKLQAPLADFIDVYNFARRLKALKGLTPYEYIYKIWTSEPDRFILNPIHQMQGLNAKGQANFY